MPLIAPAPIESARLIIRIVTEADLPGLLEVNSHEEVNRFLPYARWTSMADAQAWYERMTSLQSAGATLQFAIVDKRNDTAIGSCLLFRHDEGSARAELGYVLGRSHWGRGLMHEAMDALLDCAFDRLALRRLEAEVNPENTGSTRLLGRLGFTQEGLLRQRWVGKGRAYDVAVFGLLAHEWSPSGRGLDDQPRHGNAGTRDG